MIREALLFTLIAVTIWMLHGMDVQYYALTDPARFEWNLMIALMSQIALGIIVMLDIKKVKNQ